MPQQLQLVLDEVEGVPAAQNSANESNEDQPVTEAKNFDDTESQKAVANESAAQSKLRLVKGAQ